jgi:hypothetical protein
VSLSIFPATGFDSEDVVYPGLVCHGFGFFQKHSEGYLQSKDLQTQDLFSILSLPLRYGLKALRRIQVSLSTQAEGHTVARCKELNGTCGDSRPRLSGRAKLDFLPEAPPSRIPTQDFPDVEIIWKSCGMLRLTGFSAARYVCEVSRTVGFALVGLPA